MKLLPFVLSIFFGISAFADGSQVSVSESIIINAPVSEVWTYLGKSNLAVEWSVYFDHITLFSGTDGMLGSTRRCFRNRDETGVFWDEELKQVVLNKLRVIAVSNLHGFKPQFTNNYHFLTRQIYETLPSGQTQLTLASENSDQLILFEEKMVAASMLKTKKVFKENLVNIKAAVEEKQSYKRIFPWEPVSRF